MYKICMKIIPDNKLNKYAVPLRKYTNLGISQIKNKIEHNEVLAETHAKDFDELEKLKELINKLLDLGAKVKIFDNDIYGERDYNYQEISYEEFNNTINRLKEIAEDLQDYDDAISDE
ncbi:hypothetical protein HOO54_05480 [Bacillus sp. WMMC1349]|uniref:hypothetical protein n=1 Tax=Bacillus sp. WMMC1349 TaxID=2736254 RepID=UPI0015548E3E|nr:hypothetical protein [Bacillus sp. WMMC1349]NPC91701.1 hypothetical protein [Bacillus sp. WMMC1349]